MKEDGKVTPPGPCIVSGADFRKTGDKNLKSHYAIEDGTPPSVISGPYSLGLMTAAKVVGVEKFELEVRNGLEGKTR